MRALLLAAAGASVHGRPRPWTWLQPAQRVVMMGAYQGSGSNLRGEGRARHPSVTRKATTISGHAEEASIVQLEREVARLRRELHAALQYRSEDASAAGEDDTPGSVVLHVPRSFALPDWWVRASDAETARALELLPRLVSFIEDVEDDRMREVMQLESRLQGMDEGARVLADSMSGSVAKQWQARVEALEGALRAQTQDKTQLVSAYEARVKAAEKAAEEARAKPVEMEKTLRTALQTAQAEGAAARGALQQALSALREENTRLTQRVEAAEAASKAAVEASAASPFTSAQSMGTVCEDEVEEIISEVLHCSVEDVSHMDGYGDRYVTTPDGMRMLQETKAKERLSAKLDVDRFREDVARGVAEGRVNAALFVSLKARNIPNAGPYAVEWISGSTARDAPRDGQTALSAAADDVAATEQAMVSFRQVPVVFVSSASRDTIALAAQTTHWLWQRARAAEDAAAAAAAAADGAESEELRALHAERKAVSEALPAIFGRIELSAGEVDERLRALRRLVESAEAERARLRSCQELIDRLSSAVPFVNSPRAESEVAHHEAVQVALQFHAAHGVLPKMGQLTSVQKQIISAAGGITAVRAAAQKQLDS